MMYIIWFGAIAINIAIFCFGVWINMGISHSFGLPTSVGKAITETFIVLILIALLIGGVICVGYLINHYRTS